MAKTLFSVPLVPPIGAHGGHWLTYDVQVLWTFIFSPCPTCGWRVFDQRRAQYIRDEAECQVCRTVAPMCVLYCAEEERVLYGDPSMQKPRGVLHA